VKCELGIAGLKGYAKEWDEKNKVYRPYPKHDWASHPADGFRYLAVNIKDIGNNKPTYIPKFKGLGGVEIGGYSV
jgi:hypothetical protein